MSHNFTLAWTKGSNSSAGACQLHSDKRISLLPVWLVTPTRKKKSKKEWKKERTFLCFYPLNLLMCPSFSSFHQWRLMKGSRTVWSENIGNLCPSSLLFDKVQRATLWSHKLQGRHRHQDISHHACSYETCYLQRPSAGYAWATFTLVWICPSKLLWGVYCCERTVWLPLNEFGTRP